MESECKIRRLFFVKKHAIKKITRDLNISRNTVKRAIKGKKAGKRYKRAEQPAPKLGDFKSILESWLESDHKLSRKQRRSAKRYYKQLLDEGYKGAYDAVQRFVKGWRLQHNESFSAYVPLFFAKAEAYQFDWSEEFVEIAGVLLKVKAAHFRLCYSRKFFIAAYPRETQEMLFDAHDRAFIFFDGLTTRGIYDNMKTAVDSIFVGKERKFNSKFLSLVDHYLIEPTACTPAAGWEKGQVEKQVQNARDWIFLPRLKFDSFEELNAHLAQRCQEIAQERDHPKQKGLKIEAVFQEEVGHLRPLVAPFDGHKEQVCKVSSTCLVTFDRNRYSVDYRYANKTVIVKIYATRIDVFGNDEQIASHTRNFGRDKTIYNPWHYLPLLERKPGALRNGEPFKEWSLPASILAVKNLMMKRTGGDRECVDVLLAISEYGIEEVSVACELALADKVVNRDYILNALNRLRPTAQPEEITPPEVLKLHEEPIANCHKYNILLMEMSDAIH